MLNTYMSQMLIDFFKSIQIVQSALVNEYFMINLILFLKYTRYHTKGKQDSSAIRSTSSIDVEGFILCTLILFTKNRNHEIGYMITICSMPIFFYYLLSKILSVLKMPCDFEILFATKIALINKPSAIFQQNQ